MHGLLKNRFVLALIGGGIVIAAGVWLSSGTLAPYAATLQQPRIQKPCNYLLNTDHAHFEACFLMLDGAPRERWDFTIYQRRILYPLLAYPLMKAFGFLAGGVIASALLQIAAFAALAVYLRRRVGDGAAYTAMLLVAFYPGIYYWAGLPYNHVMIAPASLLGILLVWEIEQSASMRRVAMCALMLGVLFLGYDLLPLFAPPVMMILLLRRRFAHAAAAAIALLLPALLGVGLLAWKYGLLIENNNAEVYGNMLRAYLSPGSLSNWVQLASRAPAALLRSYFFSNFWFLPALFLVIFVINRFTTKLRMLGAEKWLLLTTLLLFLFVNLAPPTQGWQMRGSGISRIYQPAFAAMILFIARWMQAAWQARSDPRRWASARAARAAVAAVAALGVAMIANAGVIFGPVLHLTLADRVYLSFYRHAETLALTKNLDTFGRRPLGVCDTSITIENPLSKRERKELKERNRLRKLNPPKKKKKPKPAPPPAPAPAPATTTTAPTTSAPIIAPATASSTRASASALCRDG